MLLAIDLYKNLVDEKGITISLMILLESPGILRAEPYTPKANGFSAYGYSSFSQQIFYIPVAEIKSKINPNGVADDSWRKSMALVSIHALSSLRSASDETQLERNFRNTWPALFEAINAKDLHVNVAAEPPAAAATADLSGSHVQVLQALVVDGENEMQATAILCVHRAS